MRRGVRSGDCERPTITQRPRSVSDIKIDSVTVTDLPTEVARLKTVVCGERKKFEAVVAMVL